MPANFRPENIPTEPGVYRFFDKDDRVLYVGKAVVSNGSREEMERDVQRLHEYGLWATISKEEL